jgi:hypothetical protein
MSPIIGYSSTTIPQELLRIYDRSQLFEPCERGEPRFWDDMQEADDVRPGGAGYFFRIVGAIGHAQGTPAEGGDWSDPATRLQVECSVQAAQIDSVVSLSSKFLELAEDDGSYSGDAEHEAIVEAARGLFSLLNRYLVAGALTGRLAVVLTATAGSTTAQMKGPEFAFQLRRNQPVEFADVDVGGTVQAQATITDVNYRTMIVTFNTPLTLGANWGIYQRGTYGLPKPNGLRAIIDDGTFASTIFNQSRVAPNLFLNGNIMDTNPTLQDYTEELVRDLIDQIAYNQDMIPTELKCNYGITGEHYRLTTPDRIYMISGGSKDVPNYPIGANQEEIGFTYGNTKIPFKPDRDMPARELYALYRPGFRKHTLRKADWYRPGGGSPFMPMPADAGGNWTYTVGASMMVDLTISHRRLNAQGALKSIRDRGAARDT